MEVSRQDSATLRDTQVSLSWACTASILTCCKKSPNSCNPCASLLRNQFLKMRCVQNVLSMSYVLHYRLLLGLQSYIAVVRLLSLLVHQDVDKVNGPFVDLSLELNQQGRQKIFPKGNILPYLFRLLGRYLFSLEVGIVFA